MKLLTHKMSVCAALAVAGLSGIAQSAANEKPSQKFVALFNGKDLTGWVKRQGDVRLAEVIAATGAIGINMYAPLVDHSELLPDGLHPDAEGRAVIAETTANALLASVPEPVTLGLLLAGGLVELLRRRRA